MQVGLSQLIGDGSVLVVTHKIDRLGDLSTGMKVVEVLKRLGGITVNQIIVATNSKKEYRSYFDPEAKHQVISYKKISKLQGVRLAVVAPFERGVLGPELICNGYPVLMLSEYGRPLAGIPRLVHGLAAEYLCGFPSKEAEVLGLWIDPELKAWAQLGSEARLQIREQVLKELDEGLRRVLDSELPQSLYVCYGASRNVKEAFVEAICNVESEKTQNLIFVLPGNNESDWILKLSKLEGVSQISIMQRKKGGEIITLKEKQLRETGKRVILLSGFFTFQEVHRLWRLCEREVMVAGDQSPSEAISANKCWFWEEYGHKEMMGTQLRDLLRAGDEPEQLVVKPHRANAAVMALVIKKFREEHFASVDRRHHSLWEKQDCCSKVIEKACELLQGFSRFPLPVDLREEELDPFQLKQDTIYVIKAGQVGTLQLPHGEKVRSVRPELSNMLFECERGNTDYFLRVENVKK